MSYYSTSPNSAKPTQVDWIVTEARSNAARDLCWENSGVTCFIAPAIYLYEFAPYEAVFSIACAKRESNV